MSIDDRDRARFWSYVDRRDSDECWLWRGAKKGPYGQITIKGRARSAQAVAWEIYNNQPMPKDTYALHRCDNPPCVNPRHIYPGTQGDNIRRSSEIKTHRNSRKTHCSRGHELTEANTYRRANRPDKRECRICRREYNRAYYGG